MDKVILDSNIIMSDFWMNSIDFKILFEYAKSGKVEIIIPQIVKDEVIDNYCKEIQKINKDMESAFNKWQRMTDKKYIVNIRKREIQKIIDEDMEKLLEDYKKRWRNVASNITLLEYPKIDHKILVKRLMDNKKPFRNDKGYKDSLIFESIKEFIVNNQFIINNRQDKIIFITHNGKDFLEEKQKGRYELHQDLREEIPIDNLLVYTSLWDYIKNNIPEDFHIFVMVKKNSDILEEKIEEFIEENDLKREAMENIFLKYIEDIEDIDIGMRIIDMDIVSKENQNIFILNIEYEVDFNVTGYASLEDFYKKGGSLYEVLEHDEDSVQLIEWITFYVEMVVKVQKKEKEIEYKDIKITSYTF